MNMVICPPVWIRPEVIARVDTCTSLRHKHILAIQLEKINRLQERIFFNNPRITHITTKNANFLHISKRDFAIVISCDDIDLGYQAFCGCSLLKTINLDAKKINISDECFSGCIKLMSCKITTQINQSITFVQSLFRFSYRKRFFIVYAENGKGFELSVEILIARRNACVSV